MDKATNVGFQRYENYRYSGVEWLGDIPSGWECHRMKRLYSDFSKKNFPLAELLSVTQDKGVVPRSWVENRMVMPSGALESFKFIDRGDFAISLRSFEGGLEYCHHAGIISPAYTVLKRKREDLKESYFKFLFKSFSFISELQTSVVGIREGKNISYPELSYSFLPIPSALEQTAIARFLDEKTTKIDAAIAKKERLIQLLKERKQIIIQQAVTKGLPAEERTKAGLDPNVKMKDSGVEWIGEIPEHWEVSKLGFYSKKILTGPFGTQLHSHEYIDGGIPVINPSHIINGKIIPDNSQTISDNKFKELFQHELRVGEIVFGRRGEMGRCALVSGYYETMIAGTGSIKLTLDTTKLCPEYLSTYLQIESVKSWFSLNSVGTTMENLNAEILASLPIVTLPVHEQKLVMKYIEFQSSKIDQSISLQEKQIEKLKEYKATLIDSAVTGKIKVPGV